MWNNVKASNILVTNGSLFCLLGHLGPCDFFNKSKQTHKAMLYFFYLVVNWWITDETFWKDLMAKQRDNPFQICYVNSNRTIEVLDWSCTYILFCAVHCVRRPRRLALIILKSSGCVKNRFLEKAFFCRLERRNRCSAVRACLPSSELTVHKVHQRHGGSFTAAWHMV